jgi:hypothetical protein
MNINDKSQYKPVLGFFYLSKAERIVFAIITFFLGGLICSYKNQDIYSLLLEGKEHDTISGWFTIPFLLISWILLDPVLEPKWVTRMKIKVSNTKSQIKVFVVDMLIGLGFIILLQIIYALSTYFLFLIMWR